MFMAGVHACRLLWDQNVSGSVWRCSGSYFNLIAASCKCSLHSRTPHISPPRPVTLHVHNIFLSIFLLSITYFHNTVLFSLTVSFSSDLPLHPFALTKTIRLCVLHFTLYFMLPFGQVSKIIK